MAMSEELDRLADLHRRGVLTDDEFMRAKRRAIDGGGVDAGQAVDAGSLVALNTLRRTRDDRWIGGVCGGIARMTGMAPWIWRMIFVLAALCGGTGAMFYLLMWILLPVDPPIPSREAWSQAGRG